MAAAPKHGVVLSPPSPPAGKQSPEVGNDDPSHPTSVELHYRWHQCTVVHVSLQEVLGSKTAASQRLKIRHLHKILQAGDELAYLGSLAVWPAPSDLLGEAYLFFKA